MTGQTDNDDHTEVDDDNDDENEKENENENNIETYPPVGKGAEIGWKRHTITEA